MSERTNERKHWRMAEHHCDRANGAVRLCHRTMEMVVDTEKLRMLRRYLRQKGRDLAPEDQHYLDELIAKEQAHNPPQLPVSGKRA